MERFATGSELRVALTRIATRADEPTPGATPPAGAGTRRPPSEQPVVDTSPPGVGGYKPVSRTGKPVGPAQRVDRTPTSTTRPRLQPNRTFEQRRGPSLILVSGLLLAALVLGGFMWVTLRTDSPDTSFDPPLTLGPVTPPTPALHLSTVRRHSCPSPLPPPTRPRCRRPRSSRSRRTTRKARMVRRTTT